MTSSRRTNGFTLLEVTIVLTIVGLLIGGIMAGRDIIENSRRRGVVSQISSILSAFTVFEQKYGCIPGDCKKASSLGLGTSGNGNGRIDVVDLGGSTYENATFWTHLNNAGLVGAINSSWGPYTKMNDNSLFIQAGNISASAYIPVFYLGIWRLAGSTACSGQDFCRTLSPAAASYFDMKIDDGLPMTGKILAANHWTPAAAFSAPSSGSVSCILTTTTPYEYNAGYEKTGVCALLIEIYK